MVGRLRRNLADDWIDFAEHTSSHGIPRAYVSVGLRRALWFLLFFACLLAFGYQAVLIVGRFNRNDIIVGVEIKFEQIKFPAVTVCNMNPYKNSFARQSSTIKSALESFELAIERGAMAHERNKRSLPSNDHTVRASFVYCSSSVDGHYTPQAEGEEQCICASLPHDNHYWNCAPTADWSTKLCGSCDLLGNCAAMSNGSTHICHCHDRNCILSAGQVKVEGRWPLHLFTTPCRNTTCICAVPRSNEDEENTSRTVPFCGPAETWLLAQCHNCDWWGRCSRASGPTADEECICEEYGSTCFAVQRVKETRERRAAVEHRNEVRVRREERRIYERILSHYEGLLAVYSKCECEPATGCVALKEKDAANTSTCLCFFNKKNDHIWPCYRTEEWQERKCSKCSTFGDCHYAEDEEFAEVDCFCAMPIKMCVRIESAEGNSTDLTERIVKFWDILPATTVSPKQKKKADREKAYGYTGTTDPIALKAKAMENIIFAVDQLTEFEKWEISYNKSDFIIKCSFNGKECHVQQDFDAYLDPSFGACFTYVASKMENMTNERAGPAYGLRLEVFVNVTEYLPTTEAAGVRLTVHSHDEQPFPDTLGYSAPTGFVSSFGIRLKSMTRLPAPYGDCIKEGKNDDFIYKDKQYSTEGCQRSCIQRHLARTCGCGDPRFPPYRDTKNCPVDEPEKRTCLKEQIMYVTQHSNELGCKCQQPCSQDVYSVSYSASRWPAVPGDQSGCPKGMAPQHCLMYKREQGAMIEVFFEQLNYESLLESEAYGLPNLLSDFGGQLGLWMGVSVITIMEVFILLFDVTLSFLTCGMKGKKRTLMEKQSITSIRRYSFPKPT